AGDPLAVADIADAQLHQIAGAQLAVDAQVEQRHLPGAVLHLQAGPDRPDFLGFERGLLPDELALVPGHVSVRTACAFHDGPPCVEPGGVHSPTRCAGSRRGAWPWSRSIFDLELSAIGLRLRPALTGHKRLFTRSERPRRE